MASTLFFKLIGMWVVLFMPAIKSHALDTACQMPKPFQVYELSAGDLHELNVLANRLLSDQKINMEEFAQNNALVETRRIQVRSARRLMEV
jgi:hypothetical protein